ncbi:hypothetical protein [Bradyrhizobium sp. dw_411]|uniref:hypothetical protein n=1 Tax=Bradyrhizobium sp. dw_411 TaxID=2720082 RepID=UPI001BCDFCBD|nr:hypothetical protein [Bradyrhizobium sp. dw_411]
MISLPSRSSETIAITLSTDELRLSESTKNGDFSIAMTITPARPLDLKEGDTLSFEISKRFLSSWGKHYKCELFFELDKDQDTLAWQGPESSFQINAPVRFVERQKHEEEPRHLATLDAQILRDAIRYAAILIDNRPPKLQAYDGLEISGGSAKSGYLRGVSLYKSGNLPDTLKFMLPKRNVTNTLAAIGKMQGPIDVTETDQAVFIKSGNTELSWNKAGRLQSLDRILGTAMEATLNVSVTEALNSVLIASIGSDRGRIVLEQSDQGPSLSLLSIATSARYDVALKGKFRECNLSPGAKLEINIDLRDLQQVLLSIRTLDAEVSISKRLLILKSVCEEYNEVSALANLA